MRLFHLYRMRSDVIVCKQIHPEPLPVDPMEMGGSFTFHPFQGTLSWQGPWPMRRQTAPSAQEIKKHSGQAAEGDPLPRPFFFFFPPPPPPLWSPGVQTPGVLHIRIELGQACLKIYPSRGKLESKLLPHFMILRSAQAGAHVRGPS